MSDTFRFQRNESIVFWVSKDHLWHYCFKSKERVIRYRSSTGKVFFLVRKKLATVSPYCSGGRIGVFQNGACRGHTKMSMKWEGVSKRGEKW